MITLRLHTCYILVVAAVLSGCAVYTPVVDFTKQRYTNAVSYFNTFYNAQRQFNDAEDEVLKARREFLERATPNKVFTIPTSARQKFQISIEKNSKVLSFFADSKWVDDALLMIGKAYFYMEDDVRSERKFLELAVQFPSSSLVPESQLWLGKSYLRQKKTDLGLRQLEDVFDKTNQDDAEIAGQASYELAQYYYQQKDFVSAEKNYTLAAELVNDDEVLTQIYFQLGKCYSELQQYDKAMIAYESAADVSPVYIWIFQAQVQQIKTETFLQHYDGALESLHEMLRDSKNTEYFGIIHFEIANILTVQGKFAEAEEKYRYIDTAFARTEEAARSYYVLGRYFEYQMNNYDSARILYNKAKNEFPSSQITSEAVIKADIFNKHFELWKDLNRFDSLYTYELYKPEPVDSVTIPAHDSLAQKDTLVVTEEPKVKKMSKTGKQESIKDSVVVVDSVKIKERLVWEQSKSVLLDSLQRAIVRTKFELGGLFYLEIQQPDSAIRWFDEVIVKNPKSQFAPRALYTKAEIYRTLLQRSPSEREQIYRDIIAQYGDSPYANEARKNLGIPMIEMQKDTAMELFERAELLAEQKEFQSAVSSFKQLASRYVASPLSAKALYSAGWHYEHSLVNNDSAYSIYKRLVQQFPASQYSKVVQPKITEYDNELKRIETEKQKALDDAKRIEAEKQKAADDAKEKERQAKEVKKTGEKLTEPVINDSLSTGKPLESVSIDTLSTPKK